MEFRFQFHRLCQIETRRWLLVVAAVAITHLLFQSLLLPYGNALRSLFPNNIDLNDKTTLTIIQSSTSLMVRNPLTLDASSLSKGSIHDRAVLKDSIHSGGNGEISHDSGSKKKGGDIDNGFTSGDESQDNSIVFAGDNDGGTDDSVEEVLDNPIEIVLDKNVNDFPSGNVMDNNGDFPSQNVMDNNGTSSLENIRSQESSSIMEFTGEGKQDFPLDQNGKLNHEISVDNDLPQNDLQHTKIAVKSFPLESEVVTSLKNISYLRANESSSVESAILKNDFATSKNDSTKVVNPARKKMKPEMPPKLVTSIDEMNQILARHRLSSRSMRPRWSSHRDQEILAARSEIENAPVPVNDRDLYAPLFRNVSKFKRSYELMERTLKVYIYKDGKKPIFHLPILKGLYASEGWFMKLMQGNKNFIVKDPRKAHLFYMPFSSRMLEYTIYVRNSHNRTNLRQYLKEYAEKIAAKYPYWNRTGGADHFLVACHDWAPYETRHHMEHCIKALCNADVSSGFKIGRDVSLPETYVRSARNPLRDLGGKPPSQRHILAFYAGNLHGYLRPILLKYWKDRDPSMKIFGPMPPGVASKMSYIQHMKNSKYCICPKGYEVNSPRVVEAIFYECVPVIISDNFVPPFFEVFNWGAFSVILEEKDIPSLKEILLSIPEKKYLEMQLGVKKVQQHFLWHANPVKYDLFYMTLHSIWYNRVYQIKQR